MTQQIRECILDTETTGRDPVVDKHKLIEIGVVELINKIPTGRTYQVYLNPGRDIDPGAYKVHGISREFLKDKPYFKDIVDEFIEFVRGSALVIHNARFDMKFLNCELESVDYPALETYDIKVIDTLSMARRKFPGARASLDALCERFGVDNRNRQLHGALLDATLLYKVYVELCGGLQKTFTFEKNNIEDNKSKQNAASQLDKVKEIINSLLIKPSVDELKLHEEMCNKIKVISKTTIW